MPARAVADIFFTFLKYVNGVLGYSTVHGFGTPALRHSRDSQWSQFWGQRESRTPALPRLLIPTKCRVSGVSGVLEFGTPPILKIETIGSLRSAGVPGIQGLPRTLNIGGLSSPGSPGVLLAIYCLICSVPWSMSNWQKNVNFHFFKNKYFFFSFETFCHPCWTHICWNIILPTQPLSDKKQTLLT